MSYLVKYEAINGTLVGGVIKSQSSRFQLRADAELRMKAVIEANGGNCKAHIEESSKYPEIFIHCGTEPQAIGGKCFGCGRILTVEDAKKVASEPFRTTFDCKAALWNVADLAAKAWYKDACRNPHAKFCLWYRLPLPEERMSIPLISVDAPNDQYVKSIEISNAWTIPVCTQKVVDACRALPLLNLK